MIKFPMRALAAIGSPPDTPFSEIVIVASS